MPVLSPAEFLEYAGENKSPGPKQHRAAHEYGKARLAYRVYRKAYYEQSLRELCHMARLTQHLHALLQACADRDIGTPAIIVEEFEEEEKKRLEKKT